MWYHLFIYLCLLCLVQEAALRVYGLGEFANTSADESRPTIVASVRSVRVSPDCSVRNILLDVFVDRDFCCVIFFNGRLSGVVKFWSSWEQLLRLMLTRAKQGSLCSSDSLLCRTVRLQMMRTRNGKPCLHKSQKHVPLSSLSKVQLLKRKQVTPSFLLSSSFYLIQKSRLVDVNVIPVDNLRPYC